MRPGLVGARAIGIGTLLGALHLASASTVSAQPASWRLADGTARFSADYTFGSFTGSTAAVRGQVSGTMVRWAKGSVEVQLDSLTTGNGLRDQHMRDALETSAHPTARFTTDSIVPLIPSASDSARIYGTFTVRGVARPVVALGLVRSAAASTASSAQGDAWVIEATFPITLAEHGIAKGISRFMGTLRVGPVVTVSISARFRPAERAQATNSP